MQIARKAQWHGKDGVAGHVITAADRARVSGPVLRTFREIADEWRLSEKQRIALLGHPARSTYHQWMRKSQAGDGPTLPLDALLRLSGVLGIWKRLEVMFATPEQGLAWLTGPHSGTLFQGTPPLGFMTDGAQDGIMAVRRYLDALVEGAAGQGALPGDVAPVTEDDLVFA